ncbi:LuxR family transcriptional regulator [Dictyobacter arantiisoli]|uniref:HTH luxR-type domain-containing protein n=1 Tax=Dictyobacter arantiisoli TaxID=2014874 RepID=A0A5A5TAR6_9CHLR|nr:LuxR family transcriptional regulator [Dictyobacter arantiisoli]GCF08447.1 hypothetical protein KDI_20110 [Dictyobacter arantiisoli]
MVRRNIPVVVDTYLWLSDQASEETRSIAVASHEWFRWLADEQNKSFSFRQDGATMTVRHERQRNGWYWYAYRKPAGRIYKAYLGRPAEITLQRLIEAATMLGQKADNDILSLQASQGQITQNTLHSLSEPLLAEKFIIPVTAATIPRPHLYARMTAGTQSKLVILSASAGYGKTSLLSSWCQQQGRTSNAAHAWVSLDILDNDPRVFWTHILTALNMAQPGLAASALALLHASRIKTTGMLYVIKTLLNACQQLTRDIVLLLDNYHTIQADELQQELTFLLDHLPARLHLVLAGRTDPPLPLARLRVEGVLTELRHADLRFNASETEFLLTKQHDAATAQKEYIQLTAQTEGWIAGIQLAARHLNEGEGTTFTKNRYLQEYLIEEVLLKQTPEIQQFLLQTSILERLQAPLCDALREQDNSQLLLETIEQLNLFIVPLDEEGQCYRYHTLFAEALRHRLQRTQATLVRDLHRRASRWYEVQGQLVSAIYHATQVADSENVKRLLDLKISADEVKTASQRKQTTTHWIDFIAVPEQTITPPLDYVTTPHTSLILLDPDRAILQKSSMAIRSAEEAEDDTLLEPLTRRERDVLQQLLRGASNREIAQSLIISEGTVKKHVSNICSKLGVQSRTQAMAKSISLALL